MVVTPSFQLRSTHRLKHWIVDFLSFEKNSPGKRYQRIRTCLTREVEMSSSPIRRQASDVKYSEKVERRPERIPDVRYPEKVERRPDRIPDVRYPDKVERRSDRIPDARYLEKVERQPDKILPRVEWAMSRIAKGTVCMCKGERATWHFLGRIPHSLHSGFAYGKGLQSFSSSYFWAFHCFSMDSKELSSISDCFGDQKAIKTPKLNTIWLELIARVLNMLIGLKGNNYYSKVFKRVNYKLSNSTFWVVISL